MDDDDDVAGCDGDGDGDGDDGDEESAWWMPFMDDDRSLFLCSPFACFDGGVFGACEYGRRL